MQEIYNSEIFEYTRHNRWWARKESKRRVFVALSAAASTLSHSASLLHDGERWFSSSGRGRLSRSGRVNNASERDAPPVATTATETHRHRRLYARRVYIAAR